MTFTWKRELDFLKKHCAAREAPVLPAIMIEWFDLNRDGDGGPDDRSNDTQYFDSLKARMEAELAVHDILHDWRLHTNAYGWTILMQPYRRAADGPVFYLLSARRDKKLTDRAMDKLDMMLRYLGVDPEEHFMMHTRHPDEDPDVQDFWTWPAPSGPCIGEMP